MTTKRGTSVLSEKYLSENCLVLHFATRDVYCIYKGKNICSICRCISLPGLRKVTDDMKTHKNKNLRLQTPTPYKPQVSPKPFKAFNPSPTGTKAPPSKPPKIELEGKKWIVVSTPWNFILQPSNKDHLRIKAAKNVVKILASSTMQKC